MHAHVRVPGLVVFAHLLEVLVGVGTEWDRAVDVVRLAVLDELLEVARKRQLLGRGALHEHVRPVLERGLLRLLLRLRPADGHLPVLRLARAPRVVELLHDLLLRRDVDECVADLPGELRGLRLHCSHGNLDRLFREVEDAEVLDRVVLAAVRLVIALPQLPHQTDRLLEHLEPLLG